MKTTEHKHMIHIAQWAAWAPNLSTSDEWAQWAQQPANTYGELMPDVSSLPAMQRRRMNRLSRMCFSVVDQIEGSHILPQIYCSRHGDLIRSTQLLTDLANNEPLSSTSFGLSVHNAVGGAVSILQGNTQPITSVAAGANGAAQAFYEVLSHLVAYPEVVLVIYDDVVPEVYQVKDSPVFAYALLIQRGNTTQLNFAKSGIQPLMSSELNVLSQIIAGAPVLNLWKYGISPAPNQINYNNHISIKQSQSHATTQLNRHV